MENIEKILQELYQLDPGLKTNEVNLKKILAEIIQSQPTVEIDPVFISRLKLELSKKANVKTKEFNWRKYFKSFNLVYPAAAFAVVAIIFVSFRSGQNNITEKKYQTAEQPTDSFSALNLEQQKEQGKNLLAFTSKDDFIKFLENGQGTTSSYGRGGGMGTTASAPMATDSFANAENKMALPVAEQNSSENRYSSTNVQVSGIDEPDIVKTDGENLFISEESPYYFYDAQPMPMGTIENGRAFSTDEAKFAPTYIQPSQTTNVIKAFPAEELKKIGKIDKQGNLLLTNNVLVIFTYTGIYGYDVKNAENPKELWYLKYENNSQLVSARLKGGRVYFVTQNAINFTEPCPIRPLSLNGKTLEISCPNIYHPIAPISDSVTYNTFDLDPKNGEVKNKISIVGSYASTIYMSEENLYLTYGISPDSLALMIDFIGNYAKDLFPGPLLDKLTKLQTYDISNSSKVNEMAQILEKYYQGLNSDERLKKENEVSNKMSAYAKQNQRKLYSTGIAKIKLNNLSLEKTGQIPGTLLNQFSLDEYQGNLRVASTIGNSGFWWGYGFNANIESVNDLYILNGNLDTISNISDLGKNETIYSVRFVNDKAYVVTFRQTDPFYVLDLKDPKNPKTAGELKIPGFSSYLHPLEENLILGIGQENGQVKLSLFDVSNPQNPKEADKYLLKEYWSEAQNNHHAFLQDPKHGIFFLPAGGNGYIFSYKNTKLGLEKAISSLSAKRAIFIEDMLYVIGNQKISVLDEKTWEKVKEISY
ncbi:MAG: beta-propeller domain-containing protein [Candidatus Doudnabacteria bacterium]|nr:beta-propeller domain-containing protein [Candidatus Doudnabacteria bacterium]